MKRLMTTSAAILLLAAALAITGCAPMLYEGPNYDEPEIIICGPVPYPIPHPEPPVIIIVESQPPTPTPTRNTPLTKKNNSGSPRTKTPRGDRHR